MQRIEKAMVLAAGLGTRMRHVSEDLPKPLVPLAGRPLIDHVLDRLAAGGVDDAVVNVHYKADAVEAHLATRKRPRVIVSDERGELLETGGGVKKALPHFGLEPFFIHNSDSVWIEDYRPNLPSLAAAWNPQLMDALLMLAPTASSLGYDGNGDFHLDAGGRLVRRTQGVAAPYVFAGVSVAHHALFRDAPQGGFSLNVVWDRALQSGRVYGVPMSGLWMHVGTPEALSEAEVALRKADLAAS